MMLSVVWDAEKLNCEAWVAPQETVVAAVNEAATPATTGYSPSQALSLSRGEPKRGYGVAHPTT